MRRLLSICLAAAAAALAAAPVAAWADPLPLPAPTSSTPLADSALTGPEKLALADDGKARMTIPVMIDGQGPFNFVVDTGADRTVISQELAEALKLPAGPVVRIHNSGGVDNVGTVLVTNLSVGKRVIDRIEAPVLTASNLGAAGLLGIDVLRDQHVVMDFKAQQFLSIPSRSEEVDSGTIVVRGRSRFGQLILVDAVVRGVPVYVILDSGAQNTVGNLALERLLLRRAAAVGVKPTEVVSVTGRRTPAQFEDVAQMEVGGLTVKNVPLAFADLHTFARFGLADRPAMLLGMDVLGLCQKVTVDFKRREATFTLKPS